VQDKRTKHINIYDSQSMLKIFTNCKSFASSYKQNNQFILSSVIYFWYGNFRHFKKTILNFWKN